MSYGKTVTLDIPFPDAVSRVREALQEQGFGVLTEIDVTATMQAKLGKQIEDYVILGACNPPLAFQALDTDRHIGLSLPCNVVVRATEGGTVVDILDPRSWSARPNSQTTSQSPTKLAADSTPSWQRWLLTLKGLKYCPLVESAPTEEASSTRRVPESSARATLATMIVSSASAPGARAGGAVHRRRAVGGRPADHRSRNRPCSQRRHHRISAGRGHEASFALALPRRSANR